MDGRKLIGWNVRKLRVIKGFSIEELADRAGLGDSFVSKLERGQVNASIGNLELLAKSLGAKLSDLVMEPKPGERPPAPLKAGRRPQKQAAFQDSGRPERRQFARELLVKEINRLEYVVIEQVIPQIEAFFVENRKRRERGEPLREMDPRLTRVFDELQAADRILTNDYAAEPSKPKEQPSERVRTGRKHQKPQGLTRGR